MVPASGTPKNLLCERLKAVQQRAFQAICDNQTGVPMTKEEIAMEIARRRPWYQRIAFPQHGITTTDDPANAMLDAAWDNVIGNIDLQTAAMLRPQPKWQEIKNFIPSVMGLDVLEVGANCGFFSFKFAEMGARSVLGLDVAPHWLSNAEWCRSILGWDNVRFVNCDLMMYDPSRSSPEGLLRDEFTYIPLPNNCFDVVFMSTVLDHLFFPLFAIYKMIRIARRFVVIDVPQFRAVDPGQPIMHLNTAENRQHHGFTATIPFVMSYIARLGLPTDDISFLNYNEGNNVTYLIDTSRKGGALQGA
jgi:ubiquinone/menaquinone biosynthesis C-methylase UbiE